MFTRILVPTDFSPCADQALEHARTVARTFGASLHLLHVMEDPATSTMMTVESYIPDVHQFREAVTKDATRQLEARLTAGDRTALHATAQASFGAGARGIVEYATGHHIDLIVMGTHGRTGVSHLLMGSVAEHVVRTAPCPVMTVREHAAAKTVRATEIVAAVPA
jgi:nucleotide-binding universal stress UspA family protein